MHHRLHQIRFLIERGRKPPGKERGMTKEIIMKKLYNVSEWVNKARAEKDWETYEAAVNEYARLTRLLKSTEA